MADLRLVRLPISGQEPKSFLVQVLSNGSRTLDLKLVGTDGENAFLAKIRHKRIDELKAASGHCSDEEWEQILTAILVKQDNSQPDIEIKVEVQSDTEATLNFRKNIQGITQRLGSIQLKEPPADDDDALISPFDWCVSTLESREKDNEHLLAATAKAIALEESVKDLKAQLEELIKAKEDDETTLLEKFRDLLNEKKVKIRQQQLLLSAANVDPAKLADVGESQGTSRKAKASRQSKRKGVAGESSESEDGFEKMDIDEPRDGRSKKSEPQSEPEPEPDSEDAQRQTTDDEDLTQSSDGEVADSDEDRAPPPASKGKGAQRKLPSRTAKVAPPKPKSGAKGKAQGATTTKKKAATAVKNEEKTPPPRTLPFNKGKKPGPAPKAADGDTESDDEL